MTERSALDSRIRAADQLDTSLVRLSGLSVRYESGAAWVGSDVSAAIEAGGLTLLLGPSGCGKSTLLLAMSGLIPVSLPADIRGRAVFCGVDTAVAEVRDIAQNVGVVFQDPDSQVVTGSLLDEVCFGLENLLVPVDEIELRAIAALKSVGLVDTIDDARRSPTELSGGQRQRLALACALALEPRILILDEPTANLDPRASSELYALIESLRSDDRAIILVEHDLDDVIDLCTHVIVLESDGAVVLDGPPGDVIGRHSAELAALGVGLPTATRIAHRLGIRRDRMPLNDEELARFVGGELAAIRDLMTTPTRNDAQSEPLDSGRDVAVRLRGVCVKRSGREILHGIDLDVIKGEFLAIAGVNGAGKSTLTLAMAGLLPISSGTLEIDGRDLSTLDARQVGDRVGYVFQNPEHQFVTHSVRDELAYGLRVRDESEQEIDHAVAAALERFGLERYADSNPFTLSHGEKRRLSVATALITNPGVLFLDEPTFGQDLARAEEILRFVSELHRGGVTIVIVTHDLQLVSDHADRIVVLGDGEVRSIGPVDSVLFDAALLESVGLQTPPVLRATRAAAHPEPGWDGVSSLRRIGSVR